MDKFDIILVGAGPAAVAALHAFDGSQRVAVITGATVQRHPSSQLHPKILATSMARNESPGVETLLKREYDVKKPLFTTGVVGGLANYWGQQFLRYASEDPWPREMFQDFFNYEENCDSIEQLFHLEGGEQIRAGIQFDDGYHFRVPRLLMGSREDRLSGLFAMRHVFRRLTTSLGTQVFETRAEALSESGDMWRIHLQTGDTIAAPRIFLAAGVLGNSQILFKTFRDLVSARFSDHSPWMLYTIGLNSLLAERPASAPRHFNAVTIEKFEGNRCFTFASLYDMERADLNLLLASTIGRAFPFFREVPAPPGASFLKPVQVWTSKTVDNMCVDAKTNVVTAISHRHDNDREADVNLLAIADMLKGLGARVLKVTRTSPGYGFHYHGLSVSFDENKFVHVRDFLDDRTGGAIRCVDSSMLQTIGLRPPSLTAMAATRSVVRMTNLSHLGDQN